MIRMKWRLEASTLYYRVLGTFLASLIPLYVVSLMMNESGVNVVRTNISESMNSKVTFYLQSFETEIFRIENLKRQFLVDGDLLKVSKQADILSDYELTAALLRIQNIENLLKVSSVYVDDVKMYIPSIKRTIYTSNYSGALPDNEVESILKAKNTSEYPFIVWNDKIILTETLPIPANPLRPPSFLLQIELSENNIKRMLQQFVPNEEGGAILLDSQQNWFISSGREEDRIAQAFLELLRNRPLEQLDNQKTITLNDQKYWFTYKSSPELGITLIHYVPEIVAIGPLIQYRLWLWIISGLSAILVVFVSWWVFRFIYRPIRQLYRALKQIEDGNLNVQIHHKSRDEFHYLFVQFNYMTQRLQVLIHEAYEEKIRSQHSELKLLQTQINPHFLYNSYFMLHRMIYDGNLDPALQLSEHLGEYFQFITRSAKDEVTLEEEMNYTIAYVRIQIMRFGSRVESVWMDVPYSSKHFIVPRLILQPLIENAYQHGLRNKVDGGKVVIRFTSSPKEINISIEDNGDELTEEQLTKIKNLLTSPANNEEISGILNVNRRIILKLGLGSGISVSRSEMGGLQIDLTLRREEEIYVQTFDRG